MSKPQFEREVYERWIAAKAGNPEQLARYREALRWYDDQERGDLFTAPEPAPQPIPAPQPAPALITEPAPQPEIIYPDRVKIYPLVGLGSIKPGLSGAWRAWTFARAVDLNGSGEILQARLRGYLSYLGVSKRLQRYWLAAAVRSGLLTEWVYNRSGDRMYRIASQARGSAMIGVYRIDRRPVDVQALALVKSGWKRHLWAAYLATLEGRPISQKKKSELTGIEPRLQRLWQRPEGGQALSFAVYRYSDCDVRPENVEAMGGETGRHYVVTDGGKVRQRLPDGRVVHPAVSKTLKRGRTRKAQKRLNETLSSVGRGQAAVVRLFANPDALVDRFEQAKRMLRQVWALDYDQRPEHVFTHPTTSWRVVNYHASRVMPLLESAL